MQSAEANLARTVRQVRGLFSNVSGTKAQVAAQKIAVQKAQDNYNRRKNLAAGGAISQEELSHARDDLASAQSAMRNNEQQLDTTSALTTLILWMAHLLFYWYMVAAGLPVVRIMKTLKRELCSILPPEV